MNVFEVLKSNEHLWKWNVKDKWIWKAEKRGRKCQNCVWRKLEGCCIWRTWSTKKIAHITLMFWWKSSSIDKREGGGREGWMLVWQWRSRQSVVGGWPNHSHLVAHTSKPLTCRHSTPPTHHQNPPAKTLLQKSVSYTLRGHNREASEAGGSKERVIEGDRDWCKLASVEEATSRIHIKWECGALLLNRWQHKVIETTAGEAARQTANGRDETRKTVRRDYLC